MERWIPVDQFATCRYCGAEKLAWVKSQGGKWYLATARATDWGRIEACPRQWHTCDRRSSNSSNPTSPCSPHWLDQLIQAGYRALALKHHPDHGGSVGDMQQINAAVEKLRSAVSR